jgi:glycosyltransferase involved in cell wall biosynthesis
MPAKIELSVVIPARNDRAHVSRLVPTLVEGFGRHSIAGEIIVVVNGGDDGTQAACEKYGATCLVHDESLTPALARNIGAAEASGEWLGLLDADVEPLDSWFAAVRRFIDANDENVAAGWEVLVPPNSGWLPIAWQHVRMAAARTQRYINTGNLIIAKPLFDRAGGFDAVRVAGEDAEFGDRIVAAGGRHVFDAELAAIHHGEPRGVRDFFRRQLFHSEPLRDVLRAANAPLNLAIIVILATTIAGLIGAPWLWRDATPWAAALLLLGPMLFLAVAILKAAAGWRSSIALPQFPRMVAVCAVMLAARTVGTVWQLRSWRS